MEIAGAELRYSQMNKKITSFMIVSLIIVTAYIQLSTNVIRPVPEEFKARNNTARLLPPQCAQCKRILSNKRNKSTIDIKRPPWFDLMTAITPVNSSAQPQRVPYIWTEGNAGRLGNHMFLYASLFGLAWSHARMIPLWRDDRYGLRTIFKNLRIDADHKSPYINDPLTSIDEAWFSRINASHDQPTTNLRLQGYLLNKQNFGHVEDQLRHDFTFSDDVMRQAQSKLNAFEEASPLRDKDFVRVVIHVRRGDFSDLVDGFLQRNSTFFNQSMAYFDDCLPRVQFIVISDDVSWCRANIGKFGREVYFVDGDRSPAVDLAIASLSDHAILTHGTFGMWVAWFANGLTLALTPD